MKVNNIGDLTGIFKFLCQRARQNLSLLIRFEITRKQWNSERLTLNMAVYIHFTSIAELQTRAKNNAYKSNR